MVKYLLFILCFNIVYSQSVGEFGSESLLMGDVESKLKKQQELSKVDATPATGFVNNKIYYLGPGDVLFLKSIPAIPEGEIITISPDGMINLPRSYGNIDVKGKTLSEVEKIIQEKVKSSNTT